METLLGEPARLVLVGGECLYGLYADAFTLENLRHAVRAHVSSFSLVLRNGPDPLSSPPRPTCSLRTTKLRLLADRTFHLQLDQSLQLDRVLQRELLGDRLDKAVD